MDYSVFCIIKFSGLLNFLDFKTLSWQQEMPLEGKAIKQFIPWFAAKMGLFLRGNPSGPWRNGNFTAIVCENSQKWICGLFHFLNTAHIRSCKVQEFSQSIPGHQNWIYCRRWDNPRRILLSCCLFFPFQDEELGSYLTSLLKKGLPQSTPWELSPDLICLHFQCFFLLDFNKRISLFVQFLQWHQHWDFPPWKKPARESRICF